MRSKTLGLLVAVLLLAGLGVTSAEASRKRAAHVDRSLATESSVFSFFGEPSRQASRQTGARASKAGRSQATRSEGRAERRTRTASVGSELFSERPQRSTQGLGPRPAQWCGWWMRSQLGGGPEFNLAANWRRYGSASSPHVGAVVVWPHHVGIITGQAANGKWVVRSGNYGGRVADAVRSIAGAVVRS